VTAPVGLGVIGAGWMGAFHAECVAQRVPGAHLVAVADPAPGAAAALVERLGSGQAHLDAADLLADPAVQGVVIAAPAPLHAGLVEASAQAGKAVFCEKPMALTLADADRAIAACARAGVALQVGFNRRFATDFRAMHELIVAGGIGTPQLLRSLTRDPEFGDPSRVKPWTMYYETLIHDFDTLNWLNPGAAVVEVHALADALVRPDWKDRGLLDTSLVTIRFDNGAMATAEASFEAVYGYDVRGEVFGSAGMITAGDVRATAMTTYGAAGVSAPTVRLNVDLFRDAYAAELAHFADCVRTGATPEVTGADARAALAVALAAIESVQTAAPAKVAR
jgi:myo-inositol 2-dehydrogenase/D-chiro-inositol 1-dehydrogenase